jgi:hypothetical protein
MKFPLWLFGMLVFLINSSVNADDLTYADYAELPEKSMVVISPSGAKVAYRQTANGRDTLIVLDLKTSTLIRAISIEEVDPDNVYFIDDKRLILVASKNTRLFGFRGRHDVSVAFSFNLDDGKIHQLMTAGYGLYEGQSSLGGIVGISEDH